MHEDILAENQISVDCMYYEIIKGIEINEIIADTILISQVFCRMKKLRYVWNIKGVTSMMSGAG